MDRALVVVICAAVSGCGVGGGAAATPAPLLAASEEARIETSDARPSSYVGTVALAGDTLAIGVPTALATGGAQAGAVHVYARGAGGWALQQRLVSSDLASGDRFGSAVALDGDRLVVGAPGHDAAGASDAGAVYVLERSGTTWSEVARIDPPVPTASDGLGSAVELEGDLVVVGAPDASRGGLASAGEAYVFERTGPTTYVLRATLAADDPEVYDAFGQTIAIEAPRVVIGTRGSTTFPGPVYHPSAAYVFVAGATGWTLEARLRATSGPLGSGDQVGIAGDTIVASAPADMVGTARQGTIHVWRRGAGGWGEVATIVPSGTSANDFFGTGATNLSFDGTRIVVPASNTPVAGSFGAGALYVFDRVGASDAFTQQLRFVSATPEGGASLGAFVDLSADRIAVASTGATGSAGNDSGLVQVLVLAAAPEVDAGIDGGVDAGVDGGAGDDAGTDAGGGADAGVGDDSGAGDDAGSGEDAGARADAGAGDDAGSGEDAGTRTDAGVDAGAAMDAGVRVDAGGVAPDAGTAPPTSGGCGCRAGAPASHRGPLAMLALAMLVARAARARGRRRARERGLGKK